jgi:precorrin-3B methylase
MDAGDGENGKVLNVKFAGGHKTQEEDMKLFEAIKKADHAIAYGTYYKDMEQMKEDCEISQLDEIQESTEIDWNNQAQAFFALFEKEEGGKSALIFWF